ncbi:LacI family DNA-binding transcriptional regulator [Leifsonia sp. Leaf264]|uniref:LacI family DNA-binding transcriptional regulator n=1 Tax=Leifsonia sp. Leaf264 TaxID=1736314 RepID=UPI0009EA60A5|nr:LacI family DNA-binding transcriptional regulator [Leifsonia sp. Leaf264]
MQDVANLAGVSAKTVSNVLSGYEHVSPQMRERVLAAVGELGYEINVSARNLRVGRSRVIGLALPELSQAYFAELADSVIRFAGERGYAVLIEQTIADDVSEVSTAAAMRKHSIDGLIYSPLSFAADDAAHLDTEFPLVILGDPVEGSIADHVTMANVAAMRGATEHLLSLGRTRIASIGANPEGPVGTGASRLQGYVEALRNHGLEPDPALIVSASVWHRTYGVEAVERLIASGAEFDAIVCFNDALALGAMHALQRSGRRIPQDVSVVGFDDIEDSAYATPSLTTVSPRRDDIARTALDLLIDQIEGDERRESPHIVEVGFTLVVRESSAGVLVV